MAKRLVYSSDGPKCPACQRLVTACRCKKPAKAGPPSDGIVRVQRETKGRRGKGVTVITGVPLAGDELKALAKKLKARCGTGGTVKDGTIEIQGDHRETLVPLLETHGWTVKRAGG